MTCGAPEPKLVEHLGYSKSSYKRIQEKPRVEKLYSMQWRRETLDLAELATKRYIDGWKLPDLCAHFGRCENTIQWSYLMLKRQDFRHKQISEELRGKLLEVSSASEKGGKK